MVKGELKKYIGSNFIYNLLVASVLLILISIYILFSFVLRKPVEMKEFEVRFLVGDIPGFDINGTALTFGRITPGGSGTRSVIIENNHDFPVKIRVLTSEEIEDYVGYDTPFILEPGEKKNTVISISIPGDMEFGEYKGKISFVSYRIDK